MHETLKKRCPNKRTDERFKKTYRTTSYFLCLLKLEKVQGPEGWVGLVGEVGVYKKCIRYRVQTFLAQENHPKFRSKKSDIVYRYYRLNATLENNCYLGVVHVPSGLSHLLHQQLCLP